MSDKKLAILKFSTDSRRPEQLGCQFIVHADFEPNFGGIHVDVMNAMSS
jgi:hypothetical protein